MSAIVCPAIVSDVSRAGPEFAATEYCTWPVPVPVAPLTIVVQEALLLAVHEQPSALVTWTAPLPAAAPTLIFVALTPKVQPVACSNFTVCPAIVSDASRAGPGFAATENCTCPLPVPLAPLTIVAHGAALVAFQVPPSPLVTWTEPVPAEAATVTLAALTPNVQPGP